MQTYTIFNIQCAMFKWKTPDDRGLNGLMLENIVKTKTSPYRHKNVSSSRNESSP